MNRYFFDKTKRVLAIVRPDGKVTFHNGPGFEIGKSVDQNSQEQAIRVLQGFGYEETSPV